VSLLLGGTQPAVTPKFSVAARTVKVPKGTSAAANGYVEFLPAGYGVGKSRSPLLIAFHGRGENGPGTAESLENLNNNGINKLMKTEQWDHSRPFVVLTPQHDGAGCPTAAEVKSFVQFAKSKYRINEGQVYLTGLSCGARGIADYLAHYGGKDIAATVLISGDLSPAWAARGCSLARDLPIWAFHGAADDIVPDTGDRATMDHLESCPRHREMKYDSYAATGHDAWTRAYATAHHDVYAWMLGNVRNDYRAASARDPRE
jgi:predicted peptidase